MNKIISVAVILAFDLLILTGLVAVSYLDSRLRALFGWNL